MEGIIFSANDRFCLPCGILPCGTPVPHGGYGLILKAPSGYRAIQYSPSHVRNPPSDGQGCAVLVPRILSAISLWTGLESFPGVHDIDMGLLLSRNCSIPTGTTKLPRTLLKGSMLTVSIN